MTLKELRKKTDKQLKEELKRSIHWQIKWGVLYEHNFKHGITDKTVVRYYDEHTKNIEKIERIMKERNI